MISLEKPIDFDEAQEVVGCFVEFENKILMLKRVSLKPEGNTWCSPGGKMDPIDAGSHSHAIGREVSEETGIHAEPEQFRLDAIFYVVYPNGKKFVYYKYKLALERLPTVVLRKDEHSEHGWFLPDEALHLDLILHEADTIRQAYKD